MVIIIVWMLFGIFGLIENAEIIAEVEDKKAKALGMFIIAVSAPFYIFTNISDYMLEQIFGENWRDEDEDGNRFC